MCVLNWPSPLQVEWRAGTQVLAPGCQSRRHTAQEMLEGVSTTPATATTVKDQVMRKSSFILSQQILHEILTFQHSLV